MSDSEEIVKARLHYYGREKYFHSMQMVAIEGMKRFSGDPIYKYYYGIALALEGRIQEGIRELDSLLSLSEVSLGALVALIYCHKLCLTVDKEAISSYEIKLKEERKRAHHHSLYYAGLFWSFLGRMDKAKDYIDRCLKINGDYKEGILLKGWIELDKMMQSEVSSSPLEYFDNILKSSNNRNPEALFGKAKYLQITGNFGDANEILSMMVVLLQGLVPPLIEKMKVELSIFDWEQAIEETAERILSLDTRNPEAQKFKILNCICRTGDFDEASRCLKRLYGDLEKIEPKNAYIFQSIAMLFSRICGRNSKVLAVTSMFAEMAASINPNSDLYMSEVGYQCLLKGQIKDAYRYYKTALKLQESSILALSGIIACQIIEGKYDVAKGQLDFLKEAQSGNSTVNKSEILYMSAVLSRLKKSSEDEVPEDVMKILNEAVDAHFKSVRGLPFGSDYLTILNPDLVINLVKEYLIYAPNVPMEQGDSTSAPLNKVLLILEPVAKACPGLKDAHFLISKAKFLSGDMKSAASSLKHLLENLDPSDSEAYLLMSQIQLYNGSFMESQQNLELGLSYNFKMRDHPMYHLINAKIQKEQGSYESAIKTLKVGMDLVNNKSGASLNASDKVSLYLELAESLKLNGQNQEASQALQEAMTEFQGTNEEIRITVMNADLSLEKGETETALDILRSIKPSESCYTQAQEKMAKIYLHYRKDKGNYAFCYKNIVENNPSSQSYLLLGDAYMAIQEPERALEVYDSALKYNPKDTNLAIKMGQALQKTHQYMKAVNYYKEAIKNVENNRLRYDLAELQMRLKQYEKSEKTATMAIELESASYGIDSLGFTADLYCLLSKIKERTEDLLGAIEALNRAKDIRSKIIKRASMEKPDILVTQKSIASELCCQMADYAVSNHNLNEAIMKYKEALSFNPEDERTLCSLARLYLMTDDLNLCQSTCMSLLRNNKENEEATVMMADLAFRKNDYETATFHFKQLLDKRPGYWIALARLVEILRRIGRLEDVPNYLNKSESWVGARAPLEPGLNFCKGLYEWYSGKPNDALKLFNKSRRDSEWGQRSIYNMIEICLNPDNQTLGGEVFEGVSTDASLKENGEMALKTAEKLIGELNPKVGQQMLSFKLLKAFLLLGSGNDKIKVEKALQEFISLPSGDNRENVGAILGMATAYQLLKQTPKSRNQLKRVAKYSWSFEDAEYLERCWLLLADIYVQGGKYDMATELLRKVLLHNKSATKAYEYMGYIMEKESSYRDAASHYEAAWRYGNKAIPAIGYKLAFNYMKAKRFTDAIDVCHEILTVYPNYPKVKKEILDKSRDSLKR